MAGCLSGYYGFVLEVTSATFSGFNFTCFLRRQIADKLNICARRCYICKSPVSFTILTIVNLEHGATDRHGAVRTEDKIADMPFCCPLSVRVIHYLAGIAEIPEFSASPTVCICPVGWELNETLPTLRHHKELLFCFDANKNTSRVSGGPYPLMRIFD